MTARPGRLCVCICTYKRPKIMAALAKDILNQKRLPEVMVVVDGDPSSGQVKAELEQLRLSGGPEMLYLPSAHANLAFQRYIGWKAAREAGADYLLYFDDDLRLADPSVIEGLLKPMESDSGVAGVTAPCRTGNGDRFRGFEVIREQRQGLKKVNFLVRKFGAAASIAPGSLSASGHRRLPPRIDIYERVEWLQGRVMLYSMKYLTQECFSEDLFALTKIKCGLGEDTFLSRRVSFKGKLLWVNGVDILHPDEDLPNSYPIDAFHNAYAAAYSRRLLNETYRGFEPPRLIDRLQLLKSYAGNNLINLMKVITSPKRYRFQFAAGYLAGSIRGVIQKPEARTLSPGIQWEEDAEKTLGERIVIR